MEIRKLDHLSWKNGWIGVSWTKQPRGWTFLAAIGRFGVAIHTGL